MVREKKIVAKQTLLVFDKIRFWGGGRGSGGSKKGCSLVKRKRRGYGSSEQSQLSGNQR